MPSATTSPSPTCSTAFLRLSIRLLRSARVARTACPTAVRILARVRAGTSPQCRTLTRGRVRVRLSRGRRAALTSRPATDTSSTRRSDSSAGAAGRQPGLLAVDGDSVTAAGSIGPTRRSRSMPLPGVDLDRLRAGEVHRARAAGAPAGVRRVRPVSSVSSARQLATSRATADGTAGSRGRVVAPGVSCDRAARSEAVSTGRTVRVSSRRAEPDHRCSPASAGEASTTRPRVGARPGARCPVVMSPVAGYRRREPAGASRRG